MAGETVSEEIAAAISRFFFGGVGPSHQQLTEVFRRSEMDAFDPIEEDDPPIGKERRVRAVLSEAATHPSERASACVRDIISRLRSHGSFTTSSEGYAGQETIDSAKRAFFTSGWTLTDSGQLSPTVVDSIASAHRRPAIDAQINRLKNGGEDPGLLIGTAKELLESASKYVIEELGETVRPNASFEELFYFALQHLALVPQSVTVSDDSSRAVREVYDGLWKAAKAVNTLRRIEGTGHGHTALPKSTIITARAVVQAAAIVAQMLLSSLDERRSPSAGHP